MTEKLGEAIGKAVSSGDVITLDGDLGAGKTAFTRGLARGMGLSSRVTSPTFTIVNEYNDKNGIPRLFHFDTYRLNSCDDFYDAGLDEYFERDGVCAIEWSSVIKEALPAERIALSISGNGNEREITVTFSPRFEDAEKKVRETMEKEGMKILACDTSNRACSSCLWADGKPIDIRFRNDGLTHSQTFMPQVHDLMESNSCKYEDLDVLACTVGPGSFTGIRIGVSSVKTMAMVLEKPAVPVSSLEAMAWPLRDEDVLVVPLIDCRNHRAWAAAYYRGEKVLPEVASDISEIRKNCLSYRDEKLPGKKILLIGTGAKLFMEEVTPEDLVKYAEGFDEILPENVAAVSEKTVSEITAGARPEEASKVLLQKFPAAALMPVYLSKTQAERTAAEQGKDMKEIPIRYYSTNDQ